MKTNLDELRSQIDEADKQWLTALAHRFTATRKVGEFKRDNNVPLVDPAREAVQMKKIAQLAKELGVDPLLAQSILRLVIDEVVKNHIAIRDAQHDK